MNYRDEIISFAYWPLYDLGIWGEISVTIRFKKFHRLLRYHYTNFTWWAEEVSNLHPLDFQSSATDRISYPPKLWLLGFGHMRTLSFAVAGFKYLQPLALARNKSSQ